MEAARRANLSGKAMPSPVRGSGGISRRKLLAGMAAGAAVPLLAPAGARARTDMRVAIIGGGLSGLVALRELTAAGVRARLYEARGRLGGRVFTSSSGPVPSDDGGQFINGDHADMLALARHYDLPLIDRSGLKGRTLILDGGRLVPEAELVQDLRPLASRISADAAALDADYGAAAPALDALSVAQYLDRHADALAKPYVRALLEATVRTEYGQEPGDASALELIFNLPVADGQHVELIGASDERFVLRGGSGGLVQALSRDLMAHIRTGHALAALEMNGDRVKLRFANGEYDEADRVILTVPPPLLRGIDFGGLLPAPWRAFAAEMDLGRNEKLNAAYQGQPWQQMGATGDCWPLPGGFSEVWDATAGEGETGLLTWFMGAGQCAAAREADVAALRRSFEASVADALPELSGAAAPWQRRTDWASDPFARGAYSCFRPGQLTRFAGLFWVEEEGQATQRASAGPLIFAGEHLSDAYPGYMNGAAQTGRLAAQAVLTG